MHSIFGSGTFANQRKNNEATRQETFTQRDKKLISNFLEILITELIARLSTQFKIKFFLQKIFCPLALG